MMKPFNKINILFISIALLIGLILGAYLGTRVNKKLSNSSAYTLWMESAEFLKKGDLEHALIYSIQATALRNDKPLFYYTVAEIYEKKEDIPMAIEFYKMASEKYKAENNSGKVKLIEEKINQLNKKSGT